MLLWHECFLRLMMQNVVLFLPLLFIFCACLAFLLHLHVAALLILYHSVHHQNMQKLINADANLYISIFMIKQRVNISESLFNLTISYFNNY